VALVILSEVEAPLGRDEELDGAALSSRAASPLVVSIGVRRLILHFVQNDRGNGSVITSTVVGRVILRP
jgi:hypothetical protein